MTAKKEIEKNNDAFIALSHVQRRIAEMECDNEQLRNLVLDIYTDFRGVVVDNWSYCNDDFDMLRERMLELGIEIPDGY